jgi:multiple sugar transport system substrate-binding protein
MKRILMFLLIVAVILSMCVGALAKETTINVLMATGSLSRAVQLGIDLFNREYAGKYKAQMTIVPFGDIAQKEMVGFIGKTGAYDVVGVHTAWQASITRYLEPLNSYIKKDKTDPADWFGTAGVNAVTDNKHIIGFPIRGPGAEMFYYRKDLFEKAGLKVPTNREELLDAARKLTVKDASGKVIQYGFAIRAGDSYNSTCELADHLFTHGIYYLSPDNKKVNPHLRSKGTIDTLNYLATFWKEGLVPSPLGWVTDDNHGLMMQGKLAMCFESTSRVNMYNDTTKSQVAGKIGYAVLPLGKGPYPSRTFGFHWMLGIDKNSRSKEGAYEFVKFIASEKIQREMAFKESNDPSNLKVLMDPEYQKINPGAVTILKTRSEVGALVPFFVPGGEKMEKAIHDEFQKFIMGKQDTKTTADNMYNVLKQIIKE